MPLQRCIDSPEPMPVKTLTFLLVTLLLALLIVYLNVYGTHYQYNVFEFTPYHNKNIEMEVQRFGIFFYCLSLVIIFLLKIKKAFATTWVTLPYTNAALAFISVGTWIVSTSVFPKGEFQDSFFDHDFETYLQSFFIIFAVLFSVYWIIDMFIRRLQFYVHSAFVEPLQRNLKVLWALHILGSTEKEKAKLKTGKEYIYQTIDGNTAILLALKFDFTHHLARKALPKTLTYERCNDMFGKEAQEIYSAFCKKQLPVCDLESGTKKFLELHYSLLDNLRKNQAPVTRLAKFLKRTCFVLSPVFLMVSLGVVIKPSSILKVIGGIAVLFGLSLKSMFDSFMFMFVTHPFDVGDRISLDVCPMEMFVKDIGVITSQFQTVRGHAFYISNAELHSMKVHNVSRSGDQLSKIQIELSASTDTEVLNQFIDSVESFVDNCSSFSQIDTCVEKIVDCNKLIVLFVVKFRGNFCKGFKRWKRQGWITDHIIKSIQDLGIKYEPLMLKVIKE